MVVCSGESPADMHLARGVALDPVEVPCWDSIQQLYRADLQRGQDPGLCSQLLLVSLLQFTHRRLTLLFLRMMCTVQHAVHSG